MKLTPDDLARNPRLRAAVAASLARDIAAGTARAPARPQSPDPPKGRAGTTRHRCLVCETLHPSVAAVERHVDGEHGGGRYEQDGLW